MAQNKRVNIHGSKTYSKLPLENSLPKEKPRPDLKERKKQFEERTLYVTDQKLKELLYSFWIKKHTQVFSFHVCKNPECEESFISEDIKKGKNNWRYCPKCEEKGFISKI